METSPDSIIISPPIFAAQSAPSNALPSAESRPPTYDCMEHPCFFCSGLRPLRCSTSLRPWWVQVFPGSELDILGDLCMRAAGSNSMSVSEPPGRWGLSLCLNCAAEGSKVEALRGRAPPPDGLPRAPAAWFQAVLAACARSKADADRSFSSAGQGRAGQREQGEREDGIAVERTARHGSRNVRVPRRRPCRREMMYRACQGCLCELSGRRGRTAAQDGALTVSPNWSARPGGRRLERAAWPVGLGPDCRESQRRFSSAASRRSLLVEGFLNRPLAVHLESSTGSGGCRDRRAVTDVQGRGRPARPLTRNAVPIPRRNSLMQDPPACDTSFSTSGQPLVPKTLPSSSPCDSRAQAIGNRASTACDVREERSVVIEDRAATILVEPFRGGRTGQDRAGQGNGQAPG